MSAQDILKPGDVLCVRTGGWGAELIRIGEELSGKDGADNHIAVMHHWDSAGTPWALEGRPGGVGWADARAYIASPFSLNNCLQPGRDDKARAAVAAEAEYLIGTEYSWATIADDTLHAFHLPDLFRRTVHGTVPCAAVCSSYAAFLYARQGWERPNVAEEDTEPSDWAQMVLERHWSATLEP